MTPTNHKTKRLEKQELNAEGCFRFASYLVKSAVEMPRGSQKERLNKIEDNIAFADSKFLEIFCDCTNNFEFKKLSKMIKDRNEDMKGMILNDIADQRKKWFDQNYNKSI